MLKFRTTDLWSKNVQYDKVVMGKRLGIKNKILKLFKKFLLHYQIDWRSLEIKYFKIHFFFIVKHEHTMLLPLNS